MTHTKQQSARRRHCTLLRGPTALTRRWEGQKYTSGLHLGRSKQRCWQSDRDSLRIQALCLLRPKGGNFYPFAHERGTHTPSNPWFSFFLSEIIATLCLFVRLKQGPAMESRLPSNCPSSYLLSSLLSVEIATCAAMCYQSTSFGTNLQSHGSSVQLKFHPPLPTCRL